VSHRAKEIGFVDRFFGPANEIKLISLTPDLRAWLQLWIDDLESPFDRAVVLPSRRDGQTRWYALAFSDRQLRSLRDDLSAFVGPSYSDFTGQLAQLDPADPIEKAVLELTDGRAYRFEVLPAELLPARKALSLMRSIWERRPDRTQAVPRPLGRILRDFNMALEAGQSEESETLLEQLSGIGRLTASNLTFLRIQRLASLGRWQDLLALPEAETVLSLRRPMAVTEALLRAVYRTELASFEANGQALEALEHFRTVVMPRYAALFKARSIMRSPETAKLFMMLAISASPPRPGIRKELLSDPDVGLQDREYLQLLARQQPVSDSPTQADPTADASRAIESGDYDEAYRLLSQLQPALDTVPMLLRCAYELDSLDATRHVVAAMAALEPSQRTSILGQRAYRTWWEALNPPDSKGVPSEVRQPPADWVEWLERLNTDGPFPGAIEIAAAGASEWRLSTLLYDPARVADLAAALLTTRPAEAQAVIRNAAPHLVAFLRQGEEPSATLRAVYQSAILLIASDDGLGGADLVVLLDLIADLLGIGVNPTEYEDLLGYLRDTWAQVASPKYIDWCLDVMDCLAQFPTRSEAARQKFIAHLAGSLLPWLRRLDEYQIALLRLLADEAGAADFVGPMLAARETQALRSTDDEGPSLASQLRGRRVGIYTLTEAVGRHVRDILIRAVPAAHVVLNHDKVGTQKLRHLAQEADILLVAVRSAKHAATDFIDLNRAADKPTLICPGKGSASMLRTLITYLEATT
jgi:hypothetical protein